IGSSILAPILLAILSAIRSAFLIRLRRFFTRLFANAFRVALPLALHRQGDLILLQIDLDHADCDAVARADHFARVLAEAVADPRDVNEAVLMHADVNERAKV